MALPVGLHVLVIAGTQQARIVPDYTVQTAAGAPTATVQKSAAGGTKPAVTKATPGIVGDSTGNRYGADILTLLRGDF
jgi:hypothetical protein